MKKLCNDIVKNVSCWMCDSKLKKKKLSNCWIITCTDKNCSAHALLLSREELDKIESDGGETNG